jgi:ERCC4-related helicase
MLFVAAFVAAFVAVVARYSGKRDCTSEWDREFKDERTVLERKESVLLHAQTLRNDIEKGLVDVRTISCVVVDEAHRASGKFAYVEGKKIVVPTLVMTTVD